MSEMKRSLGLVILLLLAAVSCRTQETPPPVVTDTEALQEEYARMQEEALEDVRSWEADPSSSPDPRPAWADRFEAFAREHPGPDPAADALIGVLEVRAARNDVEGFLRAYDLLVQMAPDSPGMQRAFNQVMAMRLVEAGGVGILEETDPAEKRRAYDLAAPRAVADIEKALKKATSDTTRAAAHYTLGLANYQMEFNPAEALEQFSIVANEYPDWSQADSAREFARELSTLGIGMTAPGFEIETIDGRKLRLSDLKGKIVLIDFWTTWCQPCVEELPRLKHAYEKYQDSGFVIVGINLDTDTDEARRFVKKHGMSWPTSISGLGMMDPLVSQYSIQALPKSFLVGRQGKIRARSLLGEDVEKAVERLLQSG